MTSEPCDLVGASRLPAVGTTIFSVMSALAASTGAINLGQGFPDFDCDPALIDANASNSRINRPRNSALEFAATSRRQSCHYEALAGAQCRPYGSIFGGTGRIPLPRAGLVRLRYDQRKPLFESGRVRMRLPVAVKMAFATAGKIGGSAGSPNPVGGKAVRFQ